MNASRNWSLLLAVLATVAVSAFADADTQHPVTLRDTTNGVYTRGSATCSQNGDCAAGSYTADGVNLLHAADIDIPAADFWVPISASTSDWATESACGLAADSNDDGLTVVLCDDTTLEGWGGQFSTPAAVTDLYFWILARPDVAPGGAVGARIIVTCRDATPGATTSAWGTAQAVGAFSFGADEDWEALSATISASDLGVSASSVVQCQFAREPGHGTDTLTGDLAVLDTRVGIR